jgi:hypothetical protein
MKACVTLFALSALTACAGPGPTPRPDCLYERIVRVGAEVDGPVTVDFELSQRVCVIDPVASPNAPAMLAFARSAQAAGRPVHATIAPHGPRTKGDDKGSFVLVRLADTPDPARGDR